MHPWIVSVHDIGGIARQLPRQQKQHLYRKAGLFVKFGHRNSGRASFVGQRPAREHAVKHGAVAGPLLSQREIDGDSFQAPGFQRFYQLYDSHRR
jgi:hypothetical protein